MDNTANLGLSLLQPSQAQKHVTVNEALTRLDGVTQMTLTSVTVNTPPASASDGVAYGVPTGAVNAWSGNVGDVAIYSNGGWVFVTPKFGWSAFVADTSKTATFDGVNWVEAAVGISANGAASLMEVVDFDHLFGAESVSVTSDQIPQNAVVFAITGRVKTTITGTLSSFEVGVAGASNRYGSGLGLAQGSWLVGVTGQPVAYYSNTPVELTATGGDFASGEIRLALHYYLPTPPNV